jgi:flagellar hook-basal body complex protein FliE
MRSFEYCAPNLKQGKSEFQGAVTRRREMNTSAVDSLLAQMRVAAAAAGLREPTPLATKASTVDFSSVLKSSLDGVAQSQSKSEAMQKAFVLGDDRVSLSDTMIEMQKANINFQTTVQVRNKFVQAYNDIMNMQV